MFSGQLLVASSYWQNRSLLIFKSTLLCQLFHAGSKIRQSASVRLDLRRGSVNRNFSQELEITQHLACAQHDTAKWIISNGNRQAGLLTNAFVQIL